MSASPTSESKFVCDCDEWARSACAGEPFYKEHEGKRYCVFHYPGKEKSSDFQEALQRKLKNKDFDFRGVWFPDEVSFTRFDFSGPAYFNGATFSGAADFNGATFRAAAIFRSAIFSAVADFSFTTFNAYVYFDHATFGAADFNRATFRAAAIFLSATFSGAAGFNSATFSTGASFGAATFSAEAYFCSATFSAAANFNYATFNAVAEFSPTTFSAAVDFSFATFGANADFMGDTFSAAANFASVTFSAAAIFAEAYFSAAADFSGATFSAVVYFYSVSFCAEANFNGATFSAAAAFRFATFSAEGKFIGATFADHVRFAGDEARPVFTDRSQLDLQFLRVEADHLSFHTAVLRPHWFVNVDARKFDFTNVEWDLRTIDEEIENLEERGLSSPYRLLAIACRHLAVNAEENHRYEEASKFRYMAMDVRRREEWRGFAFWKLSWWYWLASGYGERVLQALVVLLGIWFVGGLLYTRVGFARWEPKLTSENDVVAAKRDDVGAPLKFSRALTYSAGVITLQKPEPRPATTTAQTVVLLETVLGPVQAALLALAIRRKFMR